MADGFARRRQSGLRRIIRHVEPPLRDAITRIRNMKDRPNLGISACLLGEKVRFDGGHRLDRYLRDVLGEFVNWIPVCPEVECGLTVPRGIMRLTQGQDSPRLVTLSSGFDQTERMLNWTKKRLNNLEKQNLGGFIFKARSPSCGMRNVKVHDSLGVPRKIGRAHV
jgi:uncharacterized protein YbbK (DUF523 family)